MATIHPADQQLVSMIVNHLKTEGLFDQFRRDCLADVDTKPAYLHLRQRVDNFVSNHLSNHTWSPQLNKNQLRNTIRQLVLQSGMLEQGVDRIVAQVVDPKVHHTFRPQVERVVRRFLSPNSSVEDELPPVVLPALVGELETEIQSDWTDAAPACVSSTDVKVSDQDDSNLKEMDISLTEESPPPAMKEEELEMDEPKDIEMEVKEEDSAENVQKIPEEIREDSQKPSSVKQKTRDRLREEYSLEDSELEGLSDISVSSVHTSDLSSFEGDSEEEELPSDSTEEGEISSEGEAGQTMASSEDAEKKPRGVRQGYVHKPFLYSRYYSDSDDEVTVEERRRSAARDKEERLLKRQQNRERMEEKRRQRAVQREERDRRRHMCVSEQRPREKEARKEQKVLEKKVALSRQRRRDSRKQDEKKKPESEGISVNKDIVRQAGDQEERKKKINMDEKNPVHSFILDLELGTEERQRSCGKSAEERARHKPKPERRRSCDTVERETKGAAEGKKGLKVKAERKSSVVSQEKFEAMDEASPKKAKTPLRGPDSTGSPEERSEVETGSEVPPRRDKHQKEMVKRSKSISEVKAEKLKPEPAQRSGSETESDGRKSDKNRVKTRENPLFSKALNRPQTLEVRSKAGVTEKKICDDKTKDSKAEKKTLQKKRDRKCVERKSVKVAESSSGPAELSVAPSDDPYAALSDITPESDEDSTITQPCSLSAEADALLSLMDVRSARSDVRQESEADLIMKEAALTLLSMDPDVSRSDAVVSADNSPPEEVHLPIIQEASSQMNVTEESRDLILMKDSDEHNREILTLETDSVKPMNITTPDGVSAERKQTLLADTESVLTADSSHHAFSTVSLLAESAQTLLAWSVESEQDLDADTVEHVRTLDVVDTLDSAQRLDADIKVSAQTFSAVESAMTLNLETKSEQNHDTDVIEPERTLDSVTTECSRTLDANTIESSQTLNADSVESAQTPDVESVRTPVALSVKDIVESVQTLDADTSGSAQINEANLVEGAQTLNAAPVVSLQTLDADPVESTATLNLDPVESAQTLDAQPVKSAATGNTDHVESAQTLEVNPVQSAQTDDADTVQTPADLKTEIVDETPLDLNDVPDTAIPKMPNVPEAAQTLETDHTPDLPADSPRPSQTHSTTDSARTSAQDQQEPTSDASETVEQVKSRRRNRSSIQRTSSAAHSALQDQDGESVEGPAETQKKLRSAAPLRDTNTVKPTIKRKRSSDALVITTAAGEMGDTQKPSKQKPTKASDVTVSVCADEEEKKELREEHKEEVKPVTLLDSSQNVGEPRKRRGRPCKIPASNTPDKCEKKEAEEEDEETLRRTTTRAASRLEAERNKSKPATRALSKRSSGEEVSTRPGRGRKRAVCSREDVAQKRVKR